MTDPSSPPAKPQSWWTRSKETLDKLFEEYGWTAVGVHVTGMILTWIGFAVAFHYGFDAGAVASAGGSYLAARGTWPVRVPITLALTPFVARLVRRLRGGERKPDPPVGP